jgi:lytic murein transglycosylase
MSTFAPVHLHRPLPAAYWRAVARLLAALLAAALALTLACQPPPARADAAEPSETEFRAFVAQVWPLAQARGVKRATFDAALDGVTFDPTVVAHANAQPEFVTPIWTYLATAVSERRVRTGRAKAEKLRAWLAKAERTYGVDRAVLMGVWGMETEFGAFQGSNNVVRALASLAYAHVAGDYFRDELIAALTILQEGDIGDADMKGSWAGAMGQTQFMPSSFLDYAVDFEGHGRRDIWMSAPDAIGSTANYLAKHGWVAGEPWGLEVRLPRGLKLAAADFSRLAPFASFAARGVRRADGRALPKKGEARLMAPAGLSGPIFLITANFKAIKNYNNSTAYAFGVGLLGEAIFGRARVRAAWPVHDVPLTQDEIREMQTRLKALGYDVGEVDGHLGDALGAALRAYQELIGATPDGYPTPALLKRLRRAGEAG